MSETVTEEKTKVQFRKRYLTTHKRARKFLNTLINDMREAHSRGDRVDVSYYRTAGYLVRLQLDFWSYESDMKITEELEELRARIDQVQGVDDA